MASNPNASSLAAEPLPPGVILAIDYGRKKLGLALSDQCGMIPRPFATWKRTNRRRDLTRLRELARQQGVRQIVVGLPLHLDGSPSEMSEEVRAFAKRLEKALGISVELMDERLSSWEAAEVVNRSRSTAPPRSNSQSSVGAPKPPLDDVAAAIILRDYLSRAHRRAGSRD